jgi:hypothetical protein
MSLGQRIDVEPLTDARLSKIKKSVFEALDQQESAEWVAGAQRSSRRWAGIRMPLFALAFAAVAVVLALGIALRAPGIDHGTFADTPSRIAPGASGSHLALGSSSIDVGGGSVLLVSGDDDRGILLVLERGSVTCEVAPRHGRPPFVVQAGAVRVRVVGTHFTVSRLEDSARVDVALGTVEVTSGGETSLVHEGGSWGALAEASRGPVVFVAPDARPETTRASVSDSKPDKLAVSPRTLAATQPPVSSHPSPEATALAIAESATATPAEAPIATAPASRPQEALVQSDRSDQKLFEEATEGEKRDPSRAIATYRALAEGSGPWAMNALFAQGRLESDRGNAAQARRILGAYLTRYPHGRNAADARALLGRAK